MSTETTKVSELESEDWVLCSDHNRKPAYLVVQLRRHAYVLPYFRLIFMEGDNSRVQIEFSSHRVIVTGVGLSSLMMHLALGLVVGLQQPTENEAKFGVRGVTARSITGPSITDIKVLESTQEDDEEEG